MISGKQLRLLKDRGATSISSVLVMDFLFRHHGEFVTMTELADFCKVSPPVICKAIDRLEATNMVQRIRAASDRRVVFVKLTKMGVQKWKEAA